MLPEQQHSLLDSYLVGVVLVVVDVMGVSVVVH